MSPINPYAPPKAATLEADTLADGVWRDGRWVVWDDQGGFPQVCLTCGEPEIASVRITLVQRPAWWRWGGLVLMLSWMFLLPGFLFYALGDAALLIWLFGFVVLLVVHFVVRRSVPLHTGWCSRHRLQRRVARIVNVLLGLGLLGLIAPLPELALICLFLYLVVQLVWQYSPWRWLLGSVSLGRRRNHHCWIQGCGPGFRQRLPDYPG